MNKQIKRIIECLLVFISVGTLYYCIEIVFKGITANNWHSDISMALLSGTMGVIAMLLNDHFTYEMDILLQVIICAVVCTILEYIVGITCNADYSIWDYRGLSYNVDGQICLLFSCIWAVLFAILIPILDYVEWKIFKYKTDTPPYYKLFGKKIFQFG